MKKIADFLFEAKMLKEIPRSGFQFLGSGNESIAEHSFCTTFIAYVMAHLDPSVDALKIISMCLVHDLAEARTGDMNVVQKKYVGVDEAKAIEDATRGLTFGHNIVKLIQEFKQGNSKEAKLAHDADQIALALELKDLMDIGYAPPKTWLRNVVDRLKTKIGNQIAEAILATHRDNWWRNNFVDTDDEN